MRLSLIILFFFAGAFNSVVAKKCELDQNLREKVKLSTFKIIPLNLYAEELSEQKARELYQQECLKPKSLTYEKLNCELFKSCKNNACKRQYAPHGSAFLLGDGKNLVTAWNVVYSSHSAPLLFLKDYLSTLESDQRSEKLSALTPAFILIDHQDRVIFDTRENISGAVSYLDWGNPLSPIYSSQAKKGEHPYSNYENISENFALISLPDNLGPGLEQGTLAVKECIFSAGYSDKYESLPFLISGGKKDLRIDNVENAVFYNALIFPGQAGGPLINNQGRVIGITTNSLKLEGGPASAARILPKEWDDFLLN